MRKVLVLLSVIAYAGNLVAQEADSNLVSRHRPGIMWYDNGLRPGKTESIRKYDRLIFEGIYNDWMGKNHDLFQNKWSSIGWNVQVIFDIPVNRKNTVSFGVGLGYSHTRIRFDDLLVRNAQNRTTVYAYLFPQDVISKSVFRTNAIFLPVELRFRTKGWQHFKFHLGGRIGYQFGASTLYTASDPNGSSEIETQSKIKGFYDLNPLLLSAHVRLGIRNWGIVASYNFKPYFTNSSSVQLNGVDLGISLSLY